MTRTLMVLFIFLFTCGPLMGAGWRESANRRVIRNESLEATFQSGILFRLKDLKNGRMLISFDPKALPADLPLFGHAGRVDLSDWDIKQTFSAKNDSVHVVLRSKDNIEWTIDWSFDASGDLVLKSSATTPSPVEEFRAFVLGCDIKSHAMVWIHAYGVGHVVNAPWEGKFLGDPVADGSPMAHPHPLVALFQGENSGWFVEGREERIGPASLLASGSGDRANLGMSRRFSAPTQSPVMYEIRIRTYKDHWEDAVDPYVQWLEDGAGLVPFEKLTPEQAWVGKLKTQAYIGVGDYEGLEKLARHVNPAETFVGRQGEMRHHAFDIGYPDYRLSDAAKSWTKRARELGFHVGMHFNVKSVSVMFPELIEKFQPGFAEVGKDADGKPVYDTIYEGPNKLYRVSAGLKAWREHLIGAIQEAVDSGVDVIYLDEAMSPGGKFVVDGLDGYEGLFLLMKEILEKYPHVAIETEQFNTLTAKYGKLALSQMPLGHPLSGFIFRKFVKVVPEGVMYSPIDAPLMDAFDCWGYMLPGADTIRETSWLQIAEAYHKYQLVPDARLPRTQVTKFAGHFTHGETPVLPKAVPAEGEKLFGFTGANGVAAFFERHPARRGLVVYEPGKEPQWFGTRHSGITTYAGAGVPAYYGFREFLRDWLIYDDEKLLGLDPDQTYWMDSEVTRSPTRFHLFKVPDNFAGVTNMESRTAPQEVGRDELYFVLRMSGKGEIGVYIPDDYDAYLNGEKLKADPATKQAFATIDAGKSGPPGLGYHIALSPEEGKSKPQTQAGPAVLLAFKKTGTELKGDWVGLPWLGSADPAKWISGNSSNGFTSGVGAVGRIIGRVPNAKSVRVQGSYRMGERTTGAPGDGVLRVNGVEVLRVPHGEAPYKETPFDVDLSAYMGQDIVLEFTADGSVRGASAEWMNPRFAVVE